MPLPRIPTRIDLSFAFSDVDRALQEYLSNTVLSSDELTTIVQFFGGPPAACAYCGSPDVRRWDHIVAISTGGETVIGNIAPACQPCDDSKQHRPFDIWMRGKARNSPATRGIPDIERRIEAINYYMNHFAYVRRPLEERLTVAEQQKLTNIRAAAAAVRSQAEDLIKEYRRRMDGGINAAKAEFFPEM
jgi:hypothetical protein